MNSCSLGGGIVKNTHRPRGHEEEKQLFLVLVGLLIITFAFSATMLIIKFFQRSLIEKKEKTKSRKDSNLQTLQLLQRTQNELYRSGVSKLFAKWARFGEVKLCEGQIFSLYS